MSTFGYRRELKKYEEVDEDELLAALSSEELQELERELADLDPDDNVPIGLRQKDQTAKIPTGVFDRDALLKYWEDENTKLLEGGRVKSGRGQEKHSDKSREAVTAGGESLDNDRRKKKENKKTGRSVCCAKEDEDESRKDVLTAAKCALKNGLTKVSKRTESTVQSQDLIPERPSGNPIVIDKALEMILSDDPTMTEVNLNNIEDISPETLLRFAEALTTNSHVHVFSLANTHADDRIAFAISKMLRENSSIKNLNIESNFVSGQGILALLAALQHNRTLVELRFHNQRHICGGKVEMEMVQLLRENTTLIKLGYQFDLPGPRMTATSILTRNQDQQRQKRIQQKSPAEGSGHVSASSTENKPPKKPSQSHQSTEKHKRNSAPPPPPPSSLEQPTRKIAETVKQHEGSNTKLNQRKPKCKKLRSGTTEKDSTDILKDLKNALKPSMQKRRDDSSRLPPPQRSSRDDLMAAIRGSSISSLKRVTQT